MLQRASWRRSQATVAPVPLPSTREQRWSHVVRYDRLSGAGITETVRLVDAVDGVNRIDVPRTSLVYRRSHVDPPKGLDQTIPEGTANKADIEAMQAADSTLHDPVVLLNMIGVWKPEEHLAKTRLRYLEPSSPSGTPVEVHDAPDGSKRTVVISSQSSSASIEFEFESWSGGWRFTRRTSGDRTAGDYQEMTMAWGDFRSDSGERVVLPRRISTTYARGGEDSLVQECEVTSMDLKSSPWDAADWKAEVAAKTAALSYDATLDQLEERR